MPELWSLSPLVPHFPDPCFVSVFGTPYAWPCLTFPIPCPFPVYPDRRSCNPISDLLIPLLCLRPYTVHSSYKSEPPMYSRPSSNTNLATRSWPLLLSKSSPSLSRLPLIPLPSAIHLKIQDPMIQEAQHISWSQIHPPASSPELRAYLVQSWHIPCLMLKESLEISLPSLPWCYPPWVQSQHLTNHLYLKPEKCLFMQLKVEYLGLILSQWQVTMDPVKVSGVQD